MARLSTSIVFGVAFGVLAACDAILGDLHEVDGVAPIDATPSGSGSSGSDSGSSPVGSGGAGSGSSKPPALDGCTVYCDPPSQLLARPVTSCAVGSCSGAKDVACPAGQAMVGMSVGFDTLAGMGEWSTSLAVACATLEVGPPRTLDVTWRAATDSASFGSTGTTKAVTSCLSDRAANGVYGTVDGDGYEHDTETSCAPVTVAYTSPNAYAGQTGQGTLVNVGGSGNGAGVDEVQSLLCPPNEVCTGLQAVNVEGEGYDGVTIVGVDCSLLSTSPPTK